MAWHYLSRDAWKKLPNVDGPVHGRIWVFSIWDFTEGFIQGTCSTWVAHQSWSCHRQCYAGCFGSKSRTPFHLRLLQYRYIDENGFRDVCCFFTKFKQSPNIYQSARCWVSARLIGRSHWHCIFKVENIRSRELSRYLGSRGFSCHIIRCGKEWWLASLRRKCCLSGLTWSGRIGFWILWSQWWPWYADRVQGSGSEVFWFNSSVTESNNMFCAFRSVIW